ncbi:hypothetical protein N7463_006770 [Penicillium fimorum]|uniref:Uncharacterized protein n=1 Tax=Penicillium fimorum TaxID=1882269 RepID=A0A9W9XWD6_9EURO|nr:hypothetical protein N7463_006770 [Penicillium fimorum]
MAKPVLEKPRLGFLKCTIITTFPCEPIVSPPFTSNPRRSVLAVDAFVESQAAFIIEEFVVISFKMVVVPLATQFAVHLVGLKVVVVTLSVLALVVLDLEADLELALVVLALEAELELTLVELDLAADLELALVPAGFPAAFVLLGRDFGASVAPFTVAVGPAGGAR